MQWISINLSILIALNSPALPSFTSLQERGKLYLQRYSPNGNQRHEYTVWKAFKIIKFGDNHISIMMSQNTKMMSLISKCLPSRIHYVGFHKLFKWVWTDWKFKDIKSYSAAQIYLNQNICAIPISPIHVLIYAHTHMHIRTYAYEYTHMHVYSTYAYAWLVCMR